MAELYPKTTRLWDLEPHYSRHVSAMTSEGLHNKSDIAHQLALRDKRIAELESAARAVIAAAQELRGWQSTAPQQALDNFDAAMAEWRRVKG